MNVLFVCTGNTCRSPMAEAVFKFITEKENLKNFAFSRGTSVFFGESINNKAKTALKNLGIENFEHTSEQISLKDIEKADIVLTMTSSHKMLLKSKFSKYSSRIYTLSEKAYGKDKEVSDPYGQNQDVYNLCAKEIFEAVEQFIKNYEYML